MSRIFNLEKSNYYKTLQRKNSITNDIMLFLANLEWKTIHCKEAAFQDAEFDSITERYKNEHESDLRIKRTSLKLKKYTLERQLTEMEKKYLQLTQAVNRLKWAIDHPENLTTRQTDILDSNRDKCYKDLDAVMPGRQLELRAKIAGVTAELEILEGSL